MFHGLSQQIKYMIKPLGMNYKLIQLHNNKIRTTSSVQPLMPKKELAKIKMKPMM